MRLRWQSLLLLTVSLLTLSLVNLFFMSSSVAADTGVYGLTLQVSSHVRTTSLTTFQLITRIPYAGAVRWYVDGVKQETTSPTLSLIMTSPGLHTVQVVLDNRETIEAQVMVTVGETVSVADVLPNPYGEDRDAEHITLSNVSADPISLTGWRVRSLVSSAVITLQGTVPPFSELSLLLSNRLVNSRGSYGLYDSTNRLVDTFSYDTAPEGTVFERYGLTWLSELPVDKEIVIHHESREPTQSIIPKLSSSPLSQSINPGTVLPLAWQVLPSIALPLLLFHRVVLSALMGLGFLLVIGPGQRNPYNR